MDDLIEQIVREARRVWPDARAIDISSTAEWQFDGGTDNESSIMVYQSKSRHPDYCIAAEHDATLPALPTKLQAMKGAT